MSARPLHKQDYSVKPQGLLYLLSRCTWLKRIGLAGFLFFLIKGLMWLVIPGVLVYLGSN